MPSAVPLVRVVRSGVEEASHAGHVAVCDAHGELVAYVGAPQTVLFARSSMKPLQAAVSLAAIGTPLPDALVSVMCASHNGEDVHVGAVRRLLQSAGLRTRALRCPPDWAMDQETRARMRAPKRVRHNCSGKHAGMLVASVHAGWDPARYLERSHPLQRRIRTAVLRASGLERVQIGVDGCGVPVHALPLASMAKIFARLAQPEGLGPVGPWAARAISAMRAEPYLVAGRNRTDTAVMAEVPGVVVKSGAEGLACAALLEPGLGIAVKIADGSGRAAGPALIHALRLLGAVDEAAGDRLAPFLRRSVLGGGRVVGETTASFRLRSVASMA
jgi:L-asparaginase II